ncbi:MAG TPA: response regulator [Kofleriaceae bacterium]|nr:response regulator [Kofleriaceae bacterium]
MSKLSVLVVDDERDILEYINDLLTAEGYEVTTLDDPKQALERIRVEIFHIVMLDLMMPAMSGLELLAQIREVDDDIAVIILTGHPRFETAQTAIQYDVSAYIQKPSSAQEFRDTIARIIKRKGIVLRSDGDVLNNMGRRIRDLRRERQLTLRQLSRRTNLSVSLLSQIERAESAASVSSLVKVAAALDVRIPDLFEGQVEPQR